jgi:carboxylate-amine ligase
MDGELIDLTDDQGRPVGREILEVAEHGEVFLANAPGNGVADDKAVYCHVPELIDFYLGERPLLESVPTYRTEDEAERLTVLERVGELVTKPVDGAGGAGVLIGPDATARQVADRREEITHDPSRWIAQEVVSLSSHPALVDRRLEPRRVDLRVFTCAVGSGDDLSYEVLPLALTRVAAKGSMVVNSSQGGGAKDTWIIGGGHGEDQPERGEDVARVRTGG